MRILLSANFIRTKIFQSPVRKFITMSGDLTPQVVFVLGGPGAGKGTQCKNIVDSYGFVHLSAGDLLREERSKPGSQVGEMIETYIKEGKIVPVEVTCSLIEAAMTKSSTKKFLVDGFPRNQDNLDGWMKAMGDRVKLLFVLFFDCSEEKCTERCLNRGQAGSGRSDDNPESLKLRFDTYMNASMPIIKHFEALNMVKRVDSNRSPKAVFEDVKTIFEAL